MGLLSQGDVSLQPRANRVHRCNLARVNEPFRECALRKCHLDLHKCSGCSRVAASEKVPNVTSDFPEISSRHFRFMATCVRMISWIEECYYTTAEIKIIEIL